MLGRNRAGSAGSFSHHITSRFASWSQQHHHHTYEKMKSSSLVALAAGHHHGPAGHEGKKPLVFLVASYVFDWLILILMGIIGLVLGEVEPIKRPFSLTNPDISFPFTIHETVPASRAFLINSVCPIFIIAIISLIFVPGNTVPKGTPRALIWRRKLWELHIGLLGLGLSVICAWFVTNGLKNMYGKPRPDLLARCQPDLANIGNYIIGGGIANTSANGQLVDPSICHNPDTKTLNDGFRSWPSGHSSSSAAGLVYLSLFIASKFAIVIPFLPPPGYSASSFSAFPSRVRAKNAKTYGHVGNDGHGSDVYELSERPARFTDAHDTHDPLSRKAYGAFGPSSSEMTISSVRRQAASPPLYLLLISLLPTFVAVWITSSRWFDYRHHGIDILSGFLIGLVAAFFAFRYYHLPISRGAGWAWGPRSPEKAFWAGIGSFSYATKRTNFKDEASYAPTPPDLEDSGVSTGYAGAAGLGSATTAHSPATPGMSVYGHRRPSDGVHPALRDGPLVPPSASKPIPSPYVARVSEDDAALEHMGRRPPTDMSSEAGAGADAKMV